ncbi:MAG: anhydro-N-acetylmuramic acid kinase [Flavobacteriales bacterium]|jgi:anhydro-N-acetylmuramic acid kinase|nr:anhydro-N-acetylmuramic acid kinase [Flavobacteriales bacterium]|tara:strand:- start:6333 stop:7400 length:1068 start_codon:yes stop_codon:yes gene_type:complete
MNNGKKYSVIGVMSGTSLDGLDIIKCSFIFKKDWEYRIHKCKTVKYSKKWFQTLSTLHQKNQKKIDQISIAYGNFIAKEINEFISKDELVDIICSHGHTIFHQPEKNITLQIGDGKTIADKTGISTINNFRNLDIKLKGQGAPLVPIGDMKLFKEHKYCLNLGGFANLSIKNKTKIKAFDICPANIILNFLANKCGVEFDINGDIGRHGKVNNYLLDCLNKIKYYQINGPKSLSREWLEKNILNIDILTEIKPEDSLATFYEHIGFQIGSKLKNKSVFITGGGAFNSFLIEKISKHSLANIVLGSDDEINFKEALIFGFLGVLKLRSEINCLSEVTGAINDSCCGEIHKYLKDMN